MTEARGIVVTGAAGETPSPATSPRRPPGSGGSHAVIGLTKTAALEGATIGIRVNAVCPGPIESRMMGSLETGVMSLLGLPDQATAKAGFTQLIPGARYGTAEEVADVVDYLLSPSSSYISGASIPVDFGLTAH
jgi:NAD(P)-dependent dehydrogenase (short-subunit alcohol dehydrogenase family)